MRKIGIVLGGIWVVLAIVLTLQAQETAIPVNPVFITAPTSTSADGLSTMLEALEATTPLPADAVTNGTTFYSSQHLENSPEPWPPLPSSFGFAVWPLGDDGVYLLDDRGYVWGQHRKKQRLATATMGGMTAMDAPSFPGDDDEDDDTNTYEGSFSSVIAFPTNSLWLQISNVANGLANLNLMNGTDSVYEIYSTVALVNGSNAWSIAAEVWPTNGAVMPFTVPATNPTNLFIWARDWTGITSLGNTVPEWWFYKYYDTVDLSDTNLDSVSSTLLYDYRNGYNPNIIHFNLDLPISPVTSSLVSGTIDIIAGAPSSMAVLVNDTNQADAVWQPYNSNLVLNLDFGNGVYNVMVGLRGSPYAQTTWQSGQVTLYSVPLVLTITNPTTSTVSVPMIQVQGFANETLSNLTYDVTNASGNFTNQAGYLTGQFYDTNLPAYTTNYFQCYDIGLTNGLNVITLHATDVAGGTATAQMSVTLDYSGDHTAPVLSILWPTNGTSIAGSNFTVQARMDDATATATATVNSNTVQGLVERSGAVWFNNLPLNSGTNTVTITATDAAGNMSETNINVIQSAVSLTINPLTGSQMNQSSVTVSGTIGDSSDQVTVNGVSASVSGNTWTANNVPVNPNDTANLNVQVTDSSNNPLAAQSLYQPQPAQVLMTSYQEKLTANDPGILCKIFYTQSFSRTVNWTLGIGGYIEQHSVDPFYTPNTCDAFVNLATNWNSVATNGTSCEGNYSETLNQAWQYSSVDQAYTFYPDSDCGGFDTYNNTLTRTVDTKIEVVGGGQRQNGMQQLVLLTASASAYSNLDVYVENDDLASYPETNLNRGGTISLPASAFLINGQPLTATTTNDNVGETVIALPAGGTQDITFTANPTNQNHYSFNVTAQDVALTILANGIDLSTNTPEFCVGQAVTNQLIFNPSLPTNAVVSYHWAASLDFVNSALPPVNPDGSTYPDIDPTLLTNNPTPMWWYSGGYKYIFCTATVQLPNGQTASVVGEGNVSIFQPQVQFAEGTPAYPMLYNYYMELGDESLQQGNMTFAAEVISTNNFPGTANWTQLNNRSASYPNAGQDTDGEFWLDTSQFYNNSTNFPPTDVRPFKGTVKFQDAPGVSDIYGFETITDSFKTYLVFKPDDDSAGSSIWVTLGIVTWGWSATESAFTLTATNITQATYSGSDQFPTWVHTGTGRHN